MKFRSGFLLMMLVVAILLPVGCTKTSPGAVDSTPSPTITQTTWTETVQTTATTTPAGGECDPVSIPIDVGMTVQETMLSNEPFHEYCLYYEANSHLGLVIELNGLTSNFELYVGLDIFLEAGGKPDWFSQNPGTQDERIGIVGPDNGYYYIQVFNLDAATGEYTLIVDTGELI